MAKCSRCGMETEVHVEGVPICSDCEVAGVPKANARPDPTLTDLQQDCTLKLNIYEDSADATMETMNSVKSLPMSAATADKLSARRKEEDDAHVEYQKARFDLMTTLEEEPVLFKPTK